MASAAATAGTRPVLLSCPHLYGSFQLSGSALPWPRALPSLSLKLPASSDTEQKCQTQRADEGEQAVFLGT